MPQEAFRALQAGRTGHAVGSLHVEQLEAVILRIADPRAMASKSRAGSTRPTPATSHTMVVGRVRSSSTAPVPSGTSIWVGEAPTISTSTCDGSKAAASCTSRGRADALLRARRRRQRSSLVPRTARTSRSGRVSSASPVSSGHPRTATGRSGGNGSTPARRAGVWSSRTSPSASHAASDGSGAARTRAQSHQSSGDAGWWSTRRRHATTMLAGSSSNAARQSAASAASMRSSSPLRAMCRSRSNGSTPRTLPVRSLRGAGGQAPRLAPVEASASRRVGALPAGLAEIGARVEDRVDELLVAGARAVAPRRARTSTPHSPRCVSSSPTAASGSARRSASGRSSAPAVIPTIPPSPTSPRRSSCCMRSRWCTTT